MIMKNQRIAAIMLAGAMLLSMTGCGNNKAKNYSKYVELGEYMGIEYTENVTEVTEADIQSQLDSFVDSLAEEEDITDRAIEDGDIANIDFVGTIDGEEFDGGSGTSYDLTIGSGSFIDGFESGLVGHNIGEEVSLDLTFPEDYAEDLAGKDVNFAVTINSIKVRTVPELTDALVKENTDYDTIDAYKDSIREELETSNKESAASEARSYIFSKVVEDSKITGYDEAEVEKLIDEEFSNFKQQAESYSGSYSYEEVLAMYGYTNEEELKEGITEYVKNYLNQKMVLYCIADKEGITVTSEETDKLVNEFKEQYQIEDEQELYDYFGDEYFELSVLSEKVIDFLKENAVLVDSLEEEASEEESTEEAADDVSEESDSEEESTEEANGENASDEETEESTSEESTEE